LPQPDSAGRHADPNQSRQTDRQKEQGFVRHDRRDLESPATRVMDDCHAGAPVSLLFQQKIREQKNSSIPWSQCGKMPCGGSVAPRRRARIPSAVCLDSPGAAAY
jgi:hypothetical protein